jgi:uncharacterized protein involved in outer membrane biogenesis
MKKILKYAGFGLGGIIILLMIVIAIVAVTFNPNDYKQYIIDVVKEKKDRTLILDGEITLSFWPKIGANLGKVSISEHKSTAEFAAVESVKVALSLIPLLKKELIVDTVYIDGARANIVKYKDGTTNFEDLLSAEDSEPTDTIQFNVKGINITNSSANYTDEASEAKYSISNFNLTTSAIALAEPIDLKTQFDIAANKPEIAANVSIKGIFLADLEQQNFAVSKLDTMIKGDLAGGKDVIITAKGNLDVKPNAQEFLVDALVVAATGVFDGANIQVNVDAPLLKAAQDQVMSEKVTLTLNQSKDKDSTKANIVIANLQGTPKAIQSTGITGDVVSVQGVRNVVANFTSPLNANLEDFIFEVPKLVGQLDIKDPALPNGAMKGGFDLSLNVDSKQETVASIFNLNIDNTKLNGNVNVASFSKPSVKFNVTADTLDLNKLLGASAKAPAKPATKIAGSDKPADLSALKNLLLEGNIKIGLILYEKFRLSGLNVGIVADGNKLVLSGLNVKFDESQIKGRVGISQFANPLYTFDIDIDKINLDKYIVADDGAPQRSKSSESKSNDQPADLSALKALNADGSLRIGQLQYGATKASNIRIDLKADGKKLSLNPLAAKVDDSQINANVGVTNFSNPAYSFNVNIDRLDTDRYITKTDAPAAKPVTTNLSNTDTPIDLSALKKLNASGEAKIGLLKIANITTRNVNVRLNAVNGIATISPFSANLYQGSMNGLLKVDARNTPVISFKQDMQGIAIGPLLVDAINNNMLDGKGTLNLDVRTTGNSVNALKKALNGNAAINLADGAIKGIDIAGTVRSMRTKLALFKDKSSVSADRTQKTDFSELTASFIIKNGVATNEDLAMKAPILRLAKGDSRGDIDIANETINYLAKPTIVKSLSGQGGADLDALAGFGIPVKITGTFAAPKFGMDFAAIGSALAKSRLIDKVSGDKAEAVKGLIGDGSKVDALKGLLGKPAEKAPLTNNQPANTETGTEAAPVAAPKSAKDQAKDEAKKKLNEMLGF